MAMVVAITALSGCSASVRPALEADALHADTSTIAADSSTSITDSSNNADVTRFAAPIASIHAFATSTFALDTEGRAYGWGFLHFEGAGEYREPHRIAALDGARRLVSVESTMTCAIFGRGELRCSFGAQPFRAVTWAGAVEDIGFTSLGVELWALGVDGQIRASIPTPLAELLRGSEPRFARVVEGLVAVNSLACRGALCCATTRDEQLSCWGRDAATFGSGAELVAVPRRVGIGKRVFFSQTTATQCVTMPNDVTSCWGTGVYDSFGISPQTNNPLPPDAICINADRLPETIPCVRPSGFVMAGLAFADGVTNHSSALVLRDDTRLVVEGAPALWGAATGARATPAHARGTNAPSTLRWLMSGEIVAASSSHACWTAESRRRLFCAGANFAGQLGAPRRQSIDERMPIEIRVAP